MTWIDWSDSEGMFGLLLDFVADEMAECDADPQRRRFLSDLSIRLKIMEARIPEIPPSAAIQTLRDVHESTDREFAADPVMTHLRDCIEELERIEDESA